MTRIAMTLVEINEKYFNKLDNELLRAESALDENVRLDEEDVARMVMEHMRVAEEFVEVLNDIGLHDYSIEYESYCIDEFWYRVYSDGDVVMEYERD